MRKTIFVIGDLVIDHAIFVEEQHRTTEKEDTVLRRQDTAGGAANTARILAVINKGPTYLWGIIGTSHWGNFRTILETSHLLDSAPSNVELRGIQDETDAKMNTITRLVSQEGGKYRRKLRYDDVDHVHVSDTKRDTIHYHLERIRRERGGLQTIIINDFDKKCLTKKHIEDIYKFAKENHIPLFVDPKRQGEKYSNIEGVAILPNLEEWCCLINQDGAEAYRKWETGLDDSSMLEKMALTSLLHLSNFTYHIIKCDKQGAVIIGPHPKLDHYCAVYRADPARVNERESEVMDPLGCGDVMTGAFAAYYDNDNGDMEAALDAFHFANIVVGCYREMPWHRMPRLERIESRRKSSADRRKSIVYQTKVSKAISYLPKELKISLRDHESADVPGIFLADKASDSEYAKALKELAKEAKKIYGWPTPKETVKNIIFGAPSGNGKTTILKGLEKGLKAIPKIRAMNIDRNKLYHTQKLSSLIDGDVESLRAKIAELASSPTPPAEDANILLIIDEAYDKLLKERSGKPFQNFLQAANAAGIRLLLADSAFFKKTGNLDVRNDISTRCENHQLPALTEHPRDIPYVLFGELLRHAERRGDLHPVKLENHVLLELIECVLKAPNGTPREELPKLKDAYDRAFAASVPVTITYGNWSGNTENTSMAASVLPVQFYTISR